MRATTSLLIGFGLALLPLTASAACDVAGADAAAVSAARDEVRSSCTCEAPSRSAYMDCVRDVVAELVEEGQLPRSCRGPVRQFASRSTCGRDDVVGCCVKKKDGPWKGAIRKATKGCVAPRNGEACEAEFPHLLDACSPESGCVANDCGNGTVDPGEDCEPPGSESCDDRCRDRCGNGEIDVSFGEECDGQTGCGPDCTLARAVCCDLGGNRCIGDTVYDAFTAYQDWLYPCVQVLYGSFSGGVCEGAPCSPPTLPGCRAGSCSEQPIDPLPLCCQQASGGCRDTVATSTGDLGEFDCGVFPTDPDRVVVGTCGGDGSCVPASN